MNLLKLSQLYYVFLSMFKKIIPPGSLFSRILLLLAVGGMMPLWTAFADGGSYQLDFSAARPGGYSKYFQGTLCCSASSGGIDADPLDPPSGEGIDDATFGDPKDSVELLAPSTMALGQIVAFEIKINVDGTTEPEGGIIEFTVGSNIKTTSGDPFGFDQSYGIFYAFVDASDTACKNLDGDEAVSSSFWITTSDEIQGTFTVEGLDDGDKAVVEVWLVLDKTIAPGTTGNVQSRLINARTEAGDNISTNNQVISLLNVEEFFTATADLSVTKSDSSDPVSIGERFTYDIAVTNLSADTVANSVVVTDSLDPNLSFAGISVNRYNVGGGPLRTPFGCSELAGTITCKLGAMVPGEVVMITVTVEVLTTAPTTGTGGDSTCSGFEDLCSEVVVSSISINPNIENNSDSEPTGVLPLPTPIPLVTPMETPDGT